MTRSSTLLFVVLCGSLAVGCQRAETPAKDQSDPAASASSKPSPSTAPNSSIIKVSVFANGEILADGKPCSLDELESRLSEVSKSKGQVHYYREAPDQEPHPKGRTVMQLIYENRLPMSVFTKPDFSQ